MPVFEKRAGGVEAVVGELVRRANDDSKRIRLLEQKNLNTESRVGTMDQTLLSQFKELKASIDKISARLDETGDRMAKMEEDIRKIAKQLERSATKSELKELEGYFELINPVTSQFITRSETERMIEEKTAKA